ncbi:hypothetical protein ACLOJK_040936 [Asimina triloba]
MDLKVEPISFAIAAVQELCNRFARCVKMFEAEAEDVMIDKKSFNELSRYISQIKVLMQELHHHRVGITDTESTKAALRALETQLRKACEILDNYKSESRLHRFLNCETILLQMQQSAEGIAEILSLLGMANLSPVLGLKANIDKIAGDLQSIEFKNAASTEAIVLEIERSMALNGQNHEHTVRLLQKVAEAVGVGQNVSLVRTELELLKQEREEFQAQKQAEALQLSQLMQFLNSSRQASGRHAVRSISGPSDPTSHFKCPLCDEVMEDPVVISCGHSFERRAIVEHLERGEKVCPVCHEEHQSLELMPNHNLRSTIQEWKQREMEAKLKNAVTTISFDDPNAVNQALEDLQVLTKTDRYRAMVTEPNVIPRIVELLQRMANVNTKAALRCLCNLANNSDHNKESIAKAGAIRYIIKQLYRGEVEPDAVTLLLELSEKEALAEQIGNATDCIPLLVSLMQNGNPDISTKVEKVVENLSFNTYFITKMAEARHFQPFIIRFSKGPSETQASMALTLTKMQLDEDTVKIFEDRKFVGPLVQMLSSSSPACKSACFQTIKKLSAYPRMAKKIRAENATIPELLGFISIYNSEQRWEQTAAEILTLLIEASDVSDFQTNSNLQELHSEYNIGIFLSFLIDSTPQNKVQFLRLLLAISNKSEIARDLLRSDDATIGHLFTSLNENNAEVTQHTLKLIYRLADDNPSGIPLPPSPLKESAVNSLVTIFTRSPENEDRSIAAGIISLLPTDDIVIDDILHKSRALKAIQDVICATENNTNMQFEEYPAQTEPLLENALAALLRYTQPTKPELRKQLIELELYPSLVHVLSRGSSIAKQRTAMALAQLSEHEIPSVNNSSTAYNFMSTMWLTRHLPSMPWCCSADPTWHHGFCSLHGSACLTMHNFCLVRGNAVRPLVQTLSETESGAAEAALLALETLLKDKRTLSHATKEIVDSHVVPAILEVLEKGSLPAKDKALDILEKISDHIDIKSKFRKSERILIQLLQDETLKKKAALVLNQMDVISKQSSYF